MLHITRVNVLVNINLEKRNTRVICHQQVSQAMDSENIDKSMIENAIQFHGLQCPRFAIVFHVLKG